MRITNNAHVYFKFKFLGLCSVMSSAEKENLVPSEPKKRKLSLQLKKKRTEEAKESENLRTERFPVVSLQAIEDTKKHMVPKNTAKSTNWAVRLFNAWCQQRNARCEEKIPDSILLTDAYEELCHWLCVSISELRKEDGSEYTPRSIAQYIAGLQRYIIDEKGVQVKLADPDNSVFRPLHRTLENRYRKLHATGVGTNRKQADVISLDEEDQLWQTGVLSSESPVSLLRAVFYLNGINFVLRGGDEHRKLKISQFNFLDVPDPDSPDQMIRCVEYTEHGSKNRPGSSHQLNQDNKVVTQFAKPELGDKCHVYLLELYLSKLPDRAVQRDIFYMKAKNRIPDSPGDPWYMDIPMGHNTLGKFLKEILREAGINPENRSNHSLRSTAISRMYENKVPDKLIMERSGHLSVSGLLPYEHSTIAQKKAVCDTLLGVPMMGVCNKEKKPEAKSTATCKSKNTALESATDDDIIRSVESGTNAAPEKQASETSNKEDMADVMRKMQFSNMTGCTFNFTMR